MLGTYQVVYMVVYKSLPVLVEVEGKPSWVQMEPATVTLKIVLCKSRASMAAAFRPGRCVKRRALPRAAAVSVPCLCHEIPIGAYLSLGSIVF